MNRSISSVMLLKTEVPTMQALYAGQRTLRHCIWPADRIFYYIDDSKVKVSNNKLNATPRSKDMCETTLPCLREKHVRFSERVQQCISLGSTNENIDDISARHCNHDTIHGINMAFIKRKRQSTSSRAINIRNEKSKSTMIAQLPATALKGSHIDISRRDTAMKRSAVIPTSAMASPPSVQVYRPLGTQQPYSYYFSEDLDGDGDGNSPMGERHGLVSGVCYQGLQDPRFTRRGYDPITRLYTNSVNTPELCMDGSQSYGGTGDGGGFRAIVDAINRACGVVRDIWGVLLNRYWQL